MRDAVNAYVKRVKELSEHVKGNEQATKKSLIEPLFALLGYDLTDPRECVPEYREDFGKNRSVKPIDYAFFENGTPIFFVEAKDVNRKLTGHDEQLADYFAKGQSAKIGILTNGVHWRFFTDLENDNIMDKRPFVEWQVVGEEPVPWDFLNLLQKSKHNSELIRTFAERQRKQNLLVEELARLLEPAPEFVRLAVEKIETRNLTTAVVDSWKPVLKAAIVEWAKQQRLSTALSSSAADTRTPAIEPKVGKVVETTQAELNGLAVVQKLLGPERPVEYEDTASYFKIHIPGRPFYAVCRLFNFGEKNSSIQIALPLETAQKMLPSLEIASQTMGWIRVSGGLDELAPLREILRLAWDQRNAAVAGGDGKDAQ